MNGTTKWTGYQNLKSISGGIIMNQKLMRNILEWLVVAWLIVGIVTAALDLTFGGFTPIMWFALALWAVLVIICSEVTMLREFLEKKK